MHRKLSALAAILAMQATAFDAGADCTAGNPTANLTESMPTSAFVNNGDGTVSHNLTGLMWKQCVQGSSGPGCATGAATPMVWRAALAASAADTAAGYGDWRLPNIKELESLVETCGSFPATNQTLFPATPGSYFWSATSYVSSPSNAWAITFGGGSSGVAAKADNRYFARLVRAGRVIDAFDAQPSKQAVVEYLDTADFANSPGGHFFYSSDLAEQAAVDAGAAGHFARTGRQFLVGGTSPVCRFYGSVTPGPNSHFSTVDVGECNALIAAQVIPTPADVQQWNFEGLSYITTPATVAANGVRSCPGTTLPLYRAYNNAYPLNAPKNPWDSNHRFASQRSDIAAMVAIGWRDEGLVFCTAR
jgi:hypothetical protein